MNPDYNKVGIIGVGMVGGTLANWFGDKAKTWDKYKETPNSREEVLNQDVIFLCIYLKNNGISQEEKDTVAEIVNDIPDGKIVINKMTTHPGFTDYLQEKFPNKIFFHNPEFLTEASAQEDFNHPKFQLIGTTYKGYDHALNILNTLPPAPVKRIISTRDSEMFKFVRNAFLSAKVIISNQVYDMCEKLNCDYDTLRGIWQYDEWIGGSHSDIFHGGFRGFGGKCLPKDLDALLQITDSELFKVVKELNEKYING